MSVRRSLHTLVIILCSIIIATLGASLITAQADCRDAAGGPIPCTPTPAPVPPTPAPPTAIPPTAAGPDNDGDGFADTDDRCPTQSGLGTFGRGDCPDPDGDFITNDGDLCPDQAGTAENGGCPLATSTPIPGAAAATAVPATVPNINPLRPSPGEVCQLATFSLERGNVRALPALGAEIVATLDPAVLYPVLGTVIGMDGTWFRIEAGWVSAAVVVIAGIDCPGAALVPAGFSIAQADYDAILAGIGLDEECVELFNGTRFCQTVLRATADDESTAGLIPWNVTTCGFGPGGVVCILNEFSIGSEDDCIPEFCEPPSLPYPPFPYPGQHPDSGAVHCADLFNELGLPAEGPGSPHYNVYGPDGSFSLGLRLPPVDPQPCQVDVLIPRPAQATSGQIPVDRLTLLTEFPPPAGAGDYLLTLDGIPGESSEGVPAPAPSVTRYNQVRFDLTGNACIPTTHGNFAVCPGNPPPPAPIGDISAVPTPDPVLDLLISLPPADPTEGNEFTCSVTNNIGVCVCNNSQACLLMKSFCGQTEMTCYGNVCGCGNQNPE